MVVGQNDGFRWGASPCLPCGRADAHPSGVHGFDERWGAGGNDGTGGSYVSADENPALFAAMSALRPRGVSSAANAALDLRSPTCGLLPPGLIDLVLICGRGR